MITFPKESFVGNSSPVTRKDMVPITGEGNLKVGSPIEKYRDDLKAILFELRDKGGLIAEYEYGGINDILNNPNTKPYLLLLILNYLKDVHDQGLSNFDKHNSDLHKQSIPKLHEIFYSPENITNVYSPAERIKQARQMVKEILDRNKTKLNKTYVQEVQTMIEEWNVMSLSSLVSLVLNNMDVKIPEDRVILTLIINDLTRLFYGMKSGSSIKKMLFPIRRWLRMRNWQKG